MSTTTPKVAVIGLGNIGKTIAGNLIKGNREIIIAGRKIEDARSLAKQLGPLATAEDTASAIVDADIIIMSVWFNVEQELLSQYRDLLKNKIIIDPSNPIAPDEKGGFRKIIDESESAGEIISAKIPEETRLVKAFGTLGAASLQTAAFQGLEQAVLFYASNDSSVDKDVEQLIADSGFDPLKVGGIDQSVRIEVFGDLHEFGKLGKPVVLKEARDKAFNS
ncbi:NADPH-dependent F420 reductase [Chryseobacterium arthrosphaerae]|uniref:NADPH-dependent F420 reductase n=1 Tax=Chryseobacterium arthrosphaerae TaxID=651561 RepID=UPI003D3325C1